MEKFLFLVNPATYKTTSIHIYAGVYAHVGMITFRPIYIFFHPFLRPKTEIGRQEFVAWQSVVWPSSISCLVSMGTGRRNVDTLTSSMKGNSSLVLAMKLMEELLEKPENLNAELGTSSVK